MKSKITKRIQLSLIISVNTDYSKVLVSQVLRRVKQSFINNFNYFYENEHQV